MQIKHHIAGALCAVVCFGAIDTKGKERKQSLIVGHKQTDTSKLSKKKIAAVKKNFRVWYGHTSHGSQITSGMRAMKSPFTFNSTGKNNALLYKEVRGDLGHKGDLRWAKKTREMLAKNNNRINVVMWSWCGGCSDNTPAGIDAYLKEMSTLEKEYPKITFIYMTGHLDGSGTQGSLNKSNERIRAYCKKHKKVLFDFADIESYDPDGNEFLSLRANDACAYAKNGKGKRNKNWCKEWLKKHPNHTIALPSSAAHTHPLNGALKGRAFWVLLTKL